MKNGYPYDTEEMDVLRSQQRRILRDIPDDIVQPLAKLDASGAVGSDRLEWLVRKRAVATMENAAGMKLLGQLQGLQDLVDLQETLVHGLAEQVDAETLAQLGRTIDAIEGEVDEARRNQPELTSHDMTVKLGGLAGLLCWADALANDGYRDPRLADLPEFALGPV